MDIDRIKIEFAIEQLEEMDNVLVGKTKALNELKDDIEISRFNGKMSGINLCREEIRRKILNLKEVLKSIEPKPVLQSIQSFKDKYKDLNQEDLDWLIEILNPDQYEKVENKYDKTHILYKKDDKTYMLQDTKTDVCYLDYDLIWSVFESKFGYNYQLFRDLTKGILEEVYNCKVVTTYPTIIL